MTTNTPGPWQYVISPDSSLALIVEADGTTVVVISVPENSTAHSDLEANVRLMAATPNMKEVLKTITEMNPYDTSSMEYVVSLAKGAIESLKEKAYECSNFC